MASYFTNEDLLEIVSPIVGDTKRVQSVHVSLTKGISFVQYRVNNKWITIDLTEEQRIQLYGDLLCSVKQIGCNCTTVSVRADAGTQVPIFNVNFVGIKEH